MDSEGGGLGKGMAKGLGLWAEKQWLRYGQAVLDQFRGMMWMSLAGPDPGIGGPRGHGFGAVFRAL